MGLKNVTMLADQTRSRILAIVSAADVALVPLSRLELFEGAVPSKLFDVLACGRPVILGIESEARRVLELADADVHVEPEDAGPTAQVVLQLRDDPEVLPRFGENGRVLSRPILPGSGWRFGQRNCC
jgi:hypothetical protein